MRPERRDPFTEARMLGLAESPPAAGAPGGEVMPTSGSPVDLDAFLPPDPQDAQIAFLFPSGPNDLERAAQALAADPNRRQQIEDLASRISRAVAAGATEASRYEAGRIPAVGDEVIYRGAPAGVLKVLDPGGPFATLHLLFERSGVPEVAASVVHDIPAGWSWLGEPPPPEPGPDDRVRAALAAGRAIPNVGDVVRLMRAKPRSYRGVELIGLRAEVVAVRDVVGAEVVLDLRVLDPVVDGLDPATASGLIEGVRGPNEHKEGWAVTAWASRFQEPDNRKLHEQPCNRCGVTITNKQAVEFLSRTWDQHSHPLVWARLCPTCADRLGRSAFIPAPAAEDHRRLDGLGDYADAHLA